MSRGKASKEARKALRTLDPGTIAYVITSQAFDRGETPGALLGVQVEVPQITVIFSDDPQAVRAKTLDQWDISANTPTDPDVFEPLLMSHGWHAVGDWCEAERGHWFVEVEKREKVAMPENTDFTVEVAGVDEFLDALSRLIAATTHATVTLQRAIPVIDGFRRGLVECDEQLHASFLRSEQYKDSPDERLARELDSAGVEADPEYRAHREHDGTPRDDCAYCPSAAEIADETRLTGD